MTNNETPHSGKSSTLDAVNTVGGLLYAPYLPKINKPDTKNASSSFGKNITFTKHPYFIEVSFTFEPQECYLKQYILLYEGRCPHFMSYKSLHDIKRLRLVSYKSLYEVNCPCFVSCKSLHEANCSRLVSYKSLHEAKRSCLVSYKSMFRVKRRHLVSYKSLHEVNSLNFLSSISYKSTI